MSKVIIAFLLILMIVLGILLFLIAVFTGALLLFARGGKKEPERVVSLPQESETVANRPS